MTPFLSIGPQGGVPLHRARILERAAADPRSFLITDGPGRHTLVFCDDEAAAALERARYQATQHLSHACCTIEMDDYGLRVRQEGTEGARAALHDLLRWLLAECGPCRVWDEETRKEVAPADLETIFQ